LKTRDRTEIIGLILQALEGEPLTRSKIMYQVMLAFNQATAYTSLLIEQGLLSYVMLDKKYAITDKGRQFLVLYNEIDRLLTTLAHVDEQEDGYLVDDNLQMQNQYGEVTII